MTPSTNTTCSAVAGLLDAHAKFDAREITSIEHSNSRQHYLSEALRAMAKDCGITLKEPLGLNSLGEYTITGEREDKHAIFAGEFGEAFSKCLSLHRPRTGLYPGAFIEATSGWCMMSHFNVEKMVLAYFSPQPEDQPAPTGAPAP